ncbi:hypothetical protein R3P38DRAFT_2795421 [Favolaschia claudopus]|uniref:Uncharacterized protein n=1 Tax=Favolaschia claudopus TaxID=2862362 RepID=A0AAW0A6V1_9AGAR
MQDPQWCVYGGSSDVAFKALRELVLHYVPVESCITFLQIDHSWSLTRFEAHFEFPPTTAEYMLIHSLIAERLSAETLNFLQLDASWANRPDDIPPDMLVTFEVMRPLLGFSHLRDVVIHSLGGVVLNDLEIENIAKAWPMLEDLRFSGDGWRPLPTRITLAGLRTLVRQCRKLRSLWISFDAFIIPPAGADGIPDNERSRLAHLRMDDSIPSSHPEPLAAYLHALFPELQTFEVNVCLTQDAWKEVKQRLWMLK